MKKKTLLLSFAVLASLSMFAQNNIQLHLAPRLGNAVFALNTEVQAGNYSYKFTRMEYYIAEIEITHDGGQVTPVSDLYLLVQPETDSLFDLGSFPSITTVEAIAFSVGVDPVANHKDPASYPASHPLAPKNPSMHWGWQAGYRFAAIEGVAGTGFSNNFEVHALGDANYFENSITTDAETLPDGNRIIHLNADYAQVLHNINVSGGLVIHGASGAAVTLLNNMKNLVFTPVVTTGTTAPNFEGDFRLLQNPASIGAAAVKYDLPAGSDYKVVVTDLTGRQVRLAPVASETGTLTLDKLSTAGMYFVQLWQNGHVVAVEKLVINR